MIARMSSICCAGTMAALMAGLAHAQSEPLATPAVGDLAPPLGLEHLQQAPDDARATWEALRGKIVILEFWATWCGPCIAAIPHINELHDEFKDDVVFIAITYEEPDDPAVSLLFEKRKYDTWLGYDTDNALHRAMGISGIPTTVVVDGYGRIAAITHPNRLTPDLIRQFMTGHREVPRPLPVEQDQFVPMATHSGIDPYSRIESPPLVQFILREAAGTSMMTSRGKGHATGLTLPLDQMLSIVFGVPTRNVDTSALAARDDRYDVVMTSPSNSPESFIELARAGVTRALGLSIARESRTVQGFDLVRAEGAEGPTSSGLDQFTSYSTSGAHLTSDSMPMTSVVDFLASHTGKPINDQTGLDAYYEIDLDVTGLESPEDLDRALRDSLGLSLQPAAHEVEFLVVTPRAQ